MSHLYRSWDDSLYITDIFDGDEGHLMELLPSTTMQEIAYVTRNIGEVQEVAKSYWGLESKVEALEV